MYSTVKSDTKYCEFVGSSCIVQKWRYGSEFLAGVVDIDYFIRLIWVQFKVISAGKFSTSKLAIFTRRLETGSI